MFALASKSTHHFKPSVISHQDLTGLLSIIMRFISLKAVFLFVHYGRLSDNNGEITAFYT